MGQHEYVVGNRPSKGATRTLGTSTRPRAPKWGAPAHTAPIGLLLVYDTERFSADQKLRPLRTYMRASAAPAAPASPPSCPPPAAQHQQWAAGQERHLAAQLVLSQQCCHSTAVCLVCLDIGGSPVGPGGALRTGRHGSSVASRRRLVEAAAHLRASQRTGEACARKAALVGTERPSRRTSRTSASGALASMASMAQAMTIAAAQWWKGKFQRACLGRVYQPRVSVSQLPAHQATCAADGNAS